MWFDASNRTGSFGFASGSVDDTAAYGSSTDGPFWVTFWFNPAWDDNLCENKNS